MVLERTPRPFRGGNTRHTRNLRAPHRGDDSHVPGPYDFDKFCADLIGVTGEGINTPLAELTIAEAKRSSLGWSFMERGGRRR